MNKTWELRESSHKEQALKTYSPQHPIRIELELYDESGVDSVGAIFERVDAPQTFIRMHVDAKGRRAPVLILLHEVTSKVAPGEYRCRHIHVQDVRGNTKNLTPDIRFRVENVTGDYEPPELRRWRM